MHAQKIDRRRLQRESADSGWRNHNKQQHKHQQQQAVEHLLSLFFVWNSHATIIC